MRLKVIVVAGMPGSGKEEFVAVAKRVGFDVVRMGDVVREEASKNSIADDDKGVGGFANDERKRHGLDVWGKRCVARVKGERTIIDGSRGVDELRVFREAFGKDVQLVAVHSAPRTRFERLVRRGRADAPKTWSEFERRDERELGWGLGDLIAIADRMIVNEGSLSDFHEQVRSLLEGI